MENRVMFITDGMGKWCRRQWELQCGHDMSGRRCQGVQGHDGKHWYYSEDGSFEWAYPDEEVKSDFDVCSGCTPPGHDHYVSPIEMHDHYYLNHYAESEVTDETEIDRLERGVMWENESIVGPVMPDKS